MRKKTYIVFFVAIAVFLVGWFVYGIDYITVNDRTWEREKEVVNNDTEQPEDLEGDKEEQIEQEQIEQEEDPEPVNQSLILLEGVPFTPQAPLANWSDPRQQDGCEEAAALMAVRWAQGRDLTLHEAEREITSAADYQLDNYGEYRDTSAADTVERILKEYFDYQDVKVVYDISAINIINELARGNIVIVPTNGQLLNNPHFNPPGPDRHMLPVIGYDRTTGEFITHDNGTRHGENYRYHEDVLINAVRDYPSGYKVPIESERKAMIVVSK